MAKELFVSKSDELADGDRKIVPNGNYEIGVYRVNGELFAWSADEADARAPVVADEVALDVGEADGLALDRHDLLEQRTPQVVMILEGAAIHHMRGMVRTLTAGGGGCRGAPCAP